MILVISMTENGAMRHHSNAWRETLKSAVFDSSIFLARNDLSTFKFVIYVILQVIKLKPRLVVAINGEYNPGLALILIFVRLLKSSSLVTWHDVTPHVGGIANRFYWLLAFLNTRISKAVLVHNFNYLTLYGLSKKSIFSPLPNLSIKYINSDFNSSKKTNTIVFLGRIEKYKGIERVLDLYTTSRVTPLRDLLVIGSLSEQYKNLFDKQFNKKITYFRYLDDKELLSILFNSSAIIMPYLHCSQSFNPYWASLTSNALIVSAEVVKALDLHNTKGVYQFNSSEELELLVSQDSVLNPYSVSDNIFNADNIFSNALNK